MKAEKEIRERLRGYKQIEEDIKQGVLSSPPIVADVQISQSISILSWVLGIEGEIK